MSSITKQPSAPNVRTDYVTPGSMLALSISFLNICTILVALRIVGRRRQKLGLGADDYLIVAAWAATVAMCINMITAVAKGFWGVTTPYIFNAYGRPIGIGPGYYESLKFTYIQQVILPVQLALTKLSVLFFYRRVLCPCSGSYLYWTTIALAVFTVLWGLVMFFLTLFQCGDKPYAVWTDPRIIGPTKCLPQAIDWFTGISDCIMDAVVFLLPLYRIFVLQLSLKRKILVLAVFAVGAASIVASLIRVGVYLPIYSGLDQHKVYADPVLLQSIIVYWGMFESGFAVMAACLPSVKAAFIGVAVDPPDCIDKATTDKKEGASRQHGRSDNPIAPDMLATTDSRLHRPSASGTPPRRQAHEHSMGHQQKKTDGGHVAGSSQRPSNGPSSSHHHHIYVHRKLSSSFAIGQTGCDLERGHGTT